MLFQPDTIHATKIRKEADYSGVRVTFLATIDGARCQIQADIGFGDAVTPGPEAVEYPTMLSGFDAPQLRAYPRYTVVAEKFEALSTLGIANSRMKDYFDLYILARHTDFDGETLCNAIQATFGRRHTQILETLPFGLSPDFAHDDQKQIQWQAFLRKNALEAQALNEVVSHLADFLVPVYEAARVKNSFPCKWPSGGPWKHSMDISIRTNGGY